MEKKYKICPPLMEEGGNKLKFDYKIIPASYVRGQGAEALQAPD